MHDRFYLHDPVLEEVIPTPSPTAPLVPSSCKNSQIIEKDISSFGALRRLSRLNN